MAARECEGRGGSVHGWERQPLVACVCRAAVAASLLLLMPLFTPAAHTMYPTLNDSAPPRADEAPLLCCTISGYGGWSGIARCKGATRARPDHEGCRNAQRLLRTCSVLPARTACLAIHLPPSVCPPSTLRAHEEDLTRWTWAHAGIAPGTHTWTLGHPATEQAA